MMKIMDPCLDNLFYDSTILSVHSTSHLSPFSPFVHILAFVFPSSPDNHTIGRPSSRSPPSRPKPSFAHYSHLLPSKMSQNGHAQQGRSKSLPRVRAGHLQAPPPNLQRVTPTPPFPKQHSCYRPKKDKERTLDGRMDMGHRSLRPCCRQRERHAHHSHGPPVEKTGAGGRGGEKGRKHMALDERPPFNLDTRIEGEDEVDELTGKYVRKKENGIRAWGSQQAQKGQQNNGFGPTTTTTGGASGSGGDPTTHWANSLRESFHRTIRLT